MSDIRGLPAPRPDPLRVGIWDWEGKTRGQWESLTAGQYPPPSFEYLTRTAEGADVVMAVCEDVHRLLTVNHPNRVLYLQETSETHPPTDLELYQLIPLVLTNDERLITKLPNARYMTLFGTWIHDFRVPEKTKSVSMISSDYRLLSGHRLRGEVADTFPNRFDGYGKRFGKYIKTKEEGLREYRFHIAIENARYNAWVTEKLFDPFATKTLPLYWGSPDLSRLAEWGFDTSGIIPWETLPQLGALLDEIEQRGPEMYEERLPAMNTNYRRSRELYCNEVALEAVLREHFGIAGTK